MENLPLFTTLKQVLKTIYEKSRKKVTNTLLNRRNTCKDKQNNLSGKMWEKYVNVDNYGLFQGKQQSLKKWKSWKKMRILNT